MTIKPVRLLLCRLGRHKRSRSHAHDDGTHIVSVCRYCGTPMIRINRTWIAGSEEPPAAG